MMGDNNRRVQFDPTTNYYGVCTECLVACMEYEEGIRDMPPQVCRGCPFEDDNT